MFNNPNVIRIDNTEVTTQLAEKAANTSGGDLENVWFPPLQPKRSDVVTTNSVESFINQTYEVLRAENPNYITRSIVGLDATESYNFYKYVFEPKNYEKTVIFGAGIHGEEKESVALLYRFMYHVCNDYNKYPQLNYVREKVRVVVLPIQNPYGFFYNQRHNGNDVDLNRNFSYNWAGYSGTNKGTSPLSEAETQHINTVISQYPDATFFVDTHNTGPIPTRDYYTSSPQWGVNYAKDIKKIMSAVAPNPDFKPFINLTNMPTLANDVQYTHKINGLTAEMIPGALGAIRDTDKDLTNGLTFIANIYLYAVRSQPLEKIELSEPKGFTVSQNKTSFQTTSTSYVEVPNITFTFSPKTSGMLILNGALSILSTDATENVFATTTVTQPSNPDIPSETNISSQQFANELVFVGARGTIPLNRVVQVFPKNDETYGDVTIKVFVRSSGGSTLQVLRSRLNITFIPNNSWGVERWENNSDGILTKRSPR